MSLAQAYKQWDGVHPIAMPLFVRLQYQLDLDYKEGATKTLFMVFETYRAPERQNYLFDRKKTKARAWSSPHQYGLAVDFVPYDAKDGWNWREDNDWQHLKRRAEEIGLTVPISWDRCHVEHPAWPQVKAAL